MIIHYKANLKLQKGVYNIYNKCYHLNDVNMQRATVRASRERVYPGHNAHLGSNSREQASKIPQNSHLNVAPFLGAR